MVTSKDLKIKINNTFSLPVSLIRIVGGGVQTGSTRHVGHWMVYCTCPGWLWWWRIWWNKDWQRKPKYSKKTCPCATLSTTNLFTCCLEVILNSVSAYILMYYVGAEENHEHFLELDSNQRPVEDETGQVINISRCVTCHTISLNHFRNYCRVYCF
jgi:hypothetical protein